MAVCRCDLKLYYTNCIMALITLADHRYSYRLIDGTSPYLSLTKQPPTIMHKGALYRVSYDCDEYAGHLARVRVHRLLDDGSYSPVLFSVCNNNGAHYGIYSSGTTMVACGDGYIGITSSAATGYFRILHVDIDRQIIELRENMQIRHMGKLYPLWDDVRQRLHVFYCKQASDDDTWDQMLIDCMDSRCKIKLGGKITDKTFLHVYDGVMYISHGIYMYSFDIDTGRLIKQEQCLNPSFSGDGPFIMSYSLLEDKALQIYVTDVRTGDVYNVASIENESPVSVVTCFPCSMRSLPC